jgi:hypothetical protein
MTRMLDILQDYCYIRSFDVRRGLVHGSMDL